MTTPVEINQSETNRRVAITGVGVVSSCGVGRESFLENIQAGRSGISVADLFEGIPTPHSIAGQAKEFSEKAIKKQYLKKVRKNLKVMCRDIQMGVASAILAIQDSGLEDISEEERKRLGILFGANLMLSHPEALSYAIDGCLEEPAHRFQVSRWGTEGIERMDPLWLLRYLPNMPSCHIGIYADARGPSNSVTLEDASGNLAIYEATRTIQRGQADMMIAGSTGTKLHPVKSVHSALWHTLLDPGDADPATVYKPFDRHRTGQVVAEGAGTFILEQIEHAQTRDAKIFGYVLGSGSSCVQDTQGTPNYQRALVHAMRAALRNAKLNPEQIGVISANGLGTIERDQAEAAAIHEVFGDYGSQIPVTAIKSYLGNSGAGNSSLELAALLLTLQEGGVPPTLNYETPDPECNLNIVHKTALEISNKVVMNINVTEAAQASVSIIEVA